MRKFEVGDRVVSLETGYDGRAGWPNGVVTATPEPGSGLYKVKFDDQSDETWVHFTHDMKHAEPASGPINHPAHYAGSNVLTGGLSNYYLSRVEFPQREDQPPYTAECEDLIESLRLNPDEANIFKEIWRSANARLGNGKPDHKALYGAEKINHYAGRNLRRVKREAQK